MLYVALALAIAALVVPRLVGWFVRRQYAAWKKLNEEWCRNWDTR